MKNDELINYWNDDKKLNKAFKEIEKDNIKIRNDFYNNSDNYKMDKKKEIINIIIFNIVIFFSIYQNNYYYFLSMNIFYTLLCFKKIYFLDLPNKKINMFLSFIPYINMVFAISEIKEFKKPF